MKVVNQNLVKTEYAIHQLRVTRTPDPAQTHSKRTPKAQTMCVCCAFGPGVNCICDVFGSKLPLI